MIIDYSTDMIYKRLVNNCFCCRCCWCCERCYLDHSGLLRWHWASEMIKPKPVIWGVWVNKSHWSRESPNIIIKSQITTKMCVYFITFAVVTPIYTYQYMHGVVCLGGTGTACSIEYAHSFVIILLSWLTHSSSFFTFFSFRIVYGCSTGTGLMMAA